jgi:hypothetical protein
MVGKRVPDNEWFERQGNGLIEPGDYGCQESEGNKMWFTCTPDGEIGWLAVHMPDRYGSYHVITEHDDETISVGGSIQGHKFKSENCGGVGPISSRNGWHGWLEKGIWREFA